MRPERLRRSGWRCAARGGFAAAPLAAAIFFAALLARAADSPVQPSPAGVYTPETFPGELGKLKAALDTAGSSSESLKSFRESIPKSWSVDAPNRHYAIPTSPFVSRLLKAEREPEARSSELSEARNYLDALAAETASLSAAPAPNPDGARAKLDAILSRSEYKPPRQRSWFDKLRDRVNDILYEFIERFFRRLGGQRSVGSALLWISLAGAVVFIAYWVFRNWFQAARATEMNLESAALPALSWQEWLFAAREAAGRADYRAAVHCAYWAGIARLQHLGALAPDRAKTPREYLRALAKSKVIVPESAASQTQALALLTTRLEKTWYGYQAATQADFQDSLTQLEILGCRLR